MARIARVVAVILLVVVSLCTTGCLHTWTQTYQEYPPDAWESSQAHRQGNPSDG